MRYAHPWNLATLAIGLGLLLAGAGYAPDWDVPISVIMAGFSYLTAVPALRLIRTRYWPVSLLMAWWSVDGCYAAYWSIVDPVALAAMRDVNWPASLCLYVACALVWSLPDTQALRDTLVAVRHLVERRRGLRSVSLRRDV